MQKQRDIVLVLSDQHNGRYTSLPGGGMADTPCLSALAGTGAVFSRAYCNSPLCVPSRSSFLTGKLPHELGIFDNESALPETVPTLAHALTVAGYETVLAGRMHFKGHDQSHGFTRRLVGDITTQYWGTGRTDLGDFQGTLQAASCQKAAGYGPSPVQEYDEAVVDSALRVLREPREKPLFLVVGLYTPHFPFVCPREDFLACLDPEEDLEDADWPCHPCYRPLVQPTDELRLRTIRSAYRGMVRFLDRQVGILHRAFRAAGDGIFIYTSDHGEQVGKRGIFGKKTLYEDSVRIPLVWEDGVHVGQTVDRAVSLLDLHRTILEEAGAEFPGGCGTHLFGTGGSPVEIETVTDDGDAFLKAVIQQDKKLIHFPDGNVLYNLSRDEREGSDLSSDFPEVCRELEGYLPGPVEEERILLEQRRRMACYPLLKSWGKLTQPEDTARFRINGENTRRPDPYLGQQLLETHPLQHDKTEK